MLHSYDDILTVMTGLLRRQHYWYAMAMDDGFVDVNPECTTGSYDLLNKPDHFNPDGQRCCSCMVVPTWWDENGTPRFAPHHPKLCPDIYATEVALLRISCQSCGAEYDAQLSWSPVLRRDALSSKIRAGTIHYGDPPCNRCAAGATMNCWDLRVLEFWTSLLDGTRVEWERIADLEIELPDTKDPDRVAQETT